MNQPVSKKALIISALAVMCMIAILLMMGREPICKCGYVKFWHGAVISSENSQHLSDWYTPSHMIHGMIFYYVGWLLFRRQNIGWRYLGAVLLEAAWEIAENTNTVIERYREVTIALDYFGDSVINSFADVVAMSVGFLLAGRLPVWATVTLAIGFEVFTMWVIRDGLALNVLMLINPLDAVLEWQSGL